MDGFEWTSSTLFKNILPASALSDGATINMSCEGVIKNDRLEY